MEGFIEVVQIDGHKTLVSVKEIKTVEEHGNNAVIFIDLTVTKKQLYVGHIIVAETYAEVVAKIKEATE